MKLIKNKEHIEEIFSDSKKIFSDFKEIFGSNYFFTTNNHSEQFILILNNLISVDNYSASFLYLNDLKNNIKTIVKIINTPNHPKTILGENPSERNEINNLINKAVLFFSKISQEIEVDINEIRDNYILELEQKISNTTKKNTALNDDLNKQLDSMKHILPDIKEQQNRILSKFKEDEELIGSFESRVSEYTKESRLSLKSHNANLRQELSDKTDELLINIYDNIKRNLKSTEDEIEELKKQATSDYIAFNSLYDEMKKLYQIAGDGKLSDHNLVQAENEKSTADQLRKFGIGWLIVALIIAIVLFSGLADKDHIMSLEWFIQRFMTITLLSSPAIYLLKESASHRHKENVYRQRGTQLATLGSYLADFNNDDKRMDVKSELIKNFYSFNDGKADTNNVPDFLNQMKEFVAVTKTFNKISPAEQPQQVQSTPVTPIHEASNADEKKKTG